MKTLELIASGDKSSDLTDLYVGLGRMLKTELERFRNNGETERFNKLMGAFESFLDDMFKKQDGQTFGSLSWIGETYFALGEISTDGSKTASYYDRAATAFSGILSRTQSDAGFATSDQLLNVKVRLVRCFRLKKDFEKAEQLLNEVLKERGNDLRTQIEGASVYQDWGSSGDYKKLEVAIKGKEAVGLWGWGGISKRIQRQKNFSERPELADGYLDARYNVSLCRFRYGKELPTKEKQKVMDVCAMELIGSSSIMKTLPDDKRIKLNELYRQVLQESGKPVTDMPRTEDIPIEQQKPKEIAGADENSETRSEKKATSSSKAAEAAKPPQGIDMMTWIAFLGCLVGGLGLVGWVMVTGGKSKSKPKSFGRKEAAVSFSGIAVEKAPPATFTAPAATKVRPKATASGSSAAPSSEAKPARARPEGGGTTAASKPRPKPPTEG